MNGYRLTDQKIVWPLGDDVTFNRTDPRTYITRSSGDAYVVGFCSTFLSQLSDNLESCHFYVICMKMIVRKRENYIRSNNSTFTYINVK